MAEARFGFWGSRAWRVDRPPALFSDAVEESQALAILAGAAGPKPHYGIRVSRMGPKILFWVTHLAQELI